MAAVTAGGKSSAFLGQVERIVASPPLASADSLCKLLRYLAHFAIDHPSAQLKEHQIATEVFGRPPQFDPRIDSTVRVQMGRLRTKLAEYYGGMGSHDSLIVDLPKGAYALSVHERPSEPAAPANGAISPAAVLPPLSAPVRTLNRAAWAFALLSVGLAAVVVYLLVPSRNVAAPATAAAPALERFWGLFAEKADRPLVVYSNAEFVGRPETGLRYFEASRDGNKQILDHYTGVGEVMAVHELDRVFALLGRELRLKRGRLLSLDDAKLSNLIFIGSPSENLSLRQLPSAEFFVFQRVLSGDRRGDLGIWNVKPRPGEAAIFLASPSGKPLTEDYALIARMPGLSANRWILTLAGSTTHGTQAAVEFVCRPKQVEALLQSLPVGQPWFEAVLRVTVRAGVPVAGELAALRFKNQ
ncbi:MAG: hypothetical protein ACKV2U_04130 [Bryobacteraceae bacterium]